MQINTLSGSSLPKASKVECEKFIKVLYNVLDGEASAEDTQFVKELITKCDYCKECYETHEELKATIREKVSRKEVPGELLSFIKSQLGGVS